MSKKLLLGTQKTFTLIISLSFLFLIWGCATFTSSEQKRCSTQAVELNTWKQVKKGLFEQGFSPKDFDMSLRKCEPNSTGSCTCDITMSGKICSDSDLEILMLILNNISGFEVGDVNFKGVKTVSFKEITFHKSDEFTNFANRQSRLSAGTSLYVGAFQTPAGRFDTYVRGAQDGMIPEIQYQGISLDMIKIEKPLRPCFDYFTSLPFKEMSSSLHQSDILIEGFDNEDNIYLHYGNRWFLLGTWHFKDEGGQQLPSHLSGGSISGGSLTLPKKY